MLLTTIMGMSASSVLTSTTVLYFHHHLTSRRPPKLLRLIFFKFLARAMCMTANVPSVNQVIPLLDEPEHPPTHDPKAPLVVDELENHYDINSSVTVKTRPASANNDDVKLAAHVKEILHHMRMMSFRLEKKERNVVLLDEWKAFASVLDRLFFWIAFVAMLITLPTFLLREDTSHGHE